MSKRTRSRYSNKKILKIIRYNQDITNEILAQKERVRAIQTLTSKIVGNSFLNSLYAISNYTDYSFIFDEVSIYNYFKLSRKG